MNAQQAVQTLCDVVDCTKPAKVRGWCRGHYSRFWYSGSPEMAPKGHGMWGTPEYWVWHGIQLRCYDPKHKKYKDYGGRGIKMSDEWRHDFAAFYRDMGSRPEGMEVERVNNDGDYCKENCIWATRSQQLNNTRVNHRLTYKGRTQTVTQWAREIDIPLGTFRARIRRGWAVERALTQPREYHFV